MQSRVAVARGEFPLSALLSPDSCAELKRLAADVAMGQAPLPGSVRVFTGDDVRAQMGKLAGRESLRLDEESLPARIEVSAEGAGASCAEIEEQMSSAIRRHDGKTAGHDIGYDIDCGMAGRIPSGAPIELTKSAWNAALSRWEVSARCVRPTDCVPFLVRISGPSAASLGLAFDHGTKPALARPSAIAVNLEEAIVVRAGDAARLTWEQQGIRVVVPVRCLEAGAAGERVRVRIVASGRTVWAVAVSRGVVKISA